jgi:tripartite-type tricarboxylate transporter receptor subunit TctC
MNTTNIQRRRVVQGLAASLASASLPSLAQSAWPARPVTILNPFPAGGGTDAFARPWAAQMSKLTGKQFIIDNRGGAGGTVGAAIAAKMAPDGHNWFMGAVHHTIAVSIYPKLDYDLERDFVPVQLIARVPQVISINPNRIPSRDLKSFIAYLKANPGKTNYGSSGSGSSHHVAAEFFKLLTGTYITHIPYRGAGPAMQDLLAGSVDMMFDGMGTSSAQIKGGKLIGLALAADQRAAAFPNLPTTTEAGLPAYKVSTWYALWAPKGTSKEAIDAMLVNSNKALQAEEVKSAWHNQAADVPNMNPEEFGRFVSAEIKRWSEVVKKSGAKLD